MSEEAPAPGGEWDGWGYTSARWRRRCRGEADEEEEKMEELDEKKQEEVEVKERV